MQPLLKLIAQHPTRRCQIFADDYERAKSELAGELVPFFDPALARAITDTWEAMIAQTKHDAPGTELRWVEIHHCGAVEAVLNPNHEESNQPLASDSAMSRY